MLKDDDFFFRLVKLWLSQNHSEWLLFIQKYWNNYKVWVLNIPGMSTLSQFNTGSYIASNLYCCIYIREQSPITIFTQYNILINLSV